MPPKEEKKGPKLSGKDKKTLKELQKKEEIENKAKELSLRAFKAHEKERQTQEKTVRLKRHQEQVRGEREVERLKAEAEEFKTVWANFTLRIDLALEEYEKHQRWASIVRDSTLPDVNNEADINSFLSIWRENEHEVPGGEDRKRDIDADFLICSQAIQLINDILLEVDTVKEDRHAPLWTQKARNKMQFHRANLVNLYTQIQSTLDRLTSNVMQYMDKYVDEGDDQPLTLCKSNVDVKYGLWCGNRVARIRSVDFPSLNIIISPKDGAHLPKQLNLMNNVAMRVLQFSFDPTSVFEKEDVGVEYYAMGGILVVETMSVPQPMKKVKDWVVRLETQLAHDVQLIPYPPVVSDGTGGVAPPIRVSFCVPPRIVVRNTAPVVGIWVPTHSCWLPEGTAEFTYDSASRRATFTTQNLTKLAIIQEKAFDVPYEQWQMYPLDNETVMFTIEGKRRGEVSDREVQIMIRNNLCRVVSPEEPELQHLRESWLSPASLLRMLSNSGYNFLLRECDASFIPDLLPKAMIMENRAYDDMALFCTSFVFASTRHNKLGEDINMALFRISKAMRDVASMDPLRVNLKDDNRWHTVRYEKERAVICRCREDDEPNLEELPGQDVHLNLYTILREMHGEEAVTQAIDAPDLLLQNAVKQILSLVRPLTWG
eukprot:RCo026597